MRNKRVSILTIALSLVFFTLFAWVITLVSALLSNENRLLDQERFTTYLAREVNRLSLALPIGEDTLSKIRDSKQFADQPLNRLSVMLNQERIVIEQIVYSVIREPIDISIVEGWSIVTLRNSLVDYPLNQLQKRLIFEGCFINANPSMARILGYDSPDELFHTISDIGKQLYVKPHLRKQLLARLHAQDTVKNFECQLYCKNGRPIWVSIRARAIRDDSGELLFLEGLLEDISERQAAKAALENAKKELERRVKERTMELQTANQALSKAKAAAEAATRARGAFLARMSHEIRTPMNGVTTAADLAMNLELPPTVRHYLKIIHSSGYALLGIINDILDFSKIEAGKLHLEHRLFTVDKVLHELVDIFINRAAEKEIELLVDMDPEMPRSLTGDALRLQQILTNLLSNAIKFTEKGGVIILLRPTSLLRGNMVEPDSAYPFASNWWQ